MSTSIQTAGKQIKISSNSRWISRKAKQETLLHHKAYITEIGKQWHVYWDSLPFMKPLFYNMRTNEVPYGAPSASPRDNPNIPPSIDYFLAPSIFQDLSNIRYHNFYPNIFPVVTHLYPQVLSHMFTFYRSFAWSKYASKQLFNMFSQWSAKQYNHKCSHQGFFNVLTVQPTLAPIRIPSPVPIFDVSHLPDSPLGLFFSDATQTFQIFGQKKPHIINHQIYHHFRLSALYPRANLLSK